MENFSLNTTDSIQETYTKSTLQILQEYLHSRGHTFEKFGVSSNPRDTDNISALLEKDVKEIWQVALKSSSDKNLGLRAGKAFGTHIQGHFLIMLAANSASIGSALENLCAYHELCSDSYHPFLTKKSDRVCLSIRDISPRPDEVERHMIECLFSAIVTTLKVLCKQAVNPISVNFSWPTPINFGEYNKVFSSSVNFESNRVSLDFSLDTLEMPIPYADELLLATLTKYARDRLSTIRQIDSWSTKVRSLVRNSGLSSTQQSIRYVADRLCVSPRTLQKRLKDEGNSYQSIIREVRTEIAKDHILNDSISLSELALQMGYSEQSAFNHAFKRWTGLTPNEFRKNLSCTTA